MPLIYHSLSPECLFVASAVCSLSVVSVIRVSTLTMLDCNTSIKYSNYLAILLFSLCFNWTHLTVFTLKWVEKIDNYRQWTLFYMSAVLKSGSCYSWLNVYSGEREITANMIFVFLFVPIVNFSISTTFQTTTKKKK